MFITVFAMDAIVLHDWVLIITDEHGSNIENLSSINETNKDTTKQHNYLSTKCKHLFQPHKQY